MFKFTYSDKNIYVKLLLILLLVFPVHGAWGIDKIKSYWCKKKAAKAKTELSAGKIYSGCYSGKKLRYSCGKKAAKTDNVAVAGVIYRACYNAD